MKKVVFKFSLLGTTGYQFKIQKGFSKILFARQTDRMTLWAEVEKDAEMEEWVTERIKIPPAHEAEVMEISSEAIFLGPEVFVNTTVNHYLCFLVPVNVTTSTVVKYQQFNTGEEIPAGAVHQCSIVSGTLGDFVRHIYLLA